MRRRCHAPADSQFYAYGARGITVCDEWRSDFWQFVDDVGDPPGPGRGWTLDRNVRWATLSEQARNTRARDRSGIRPRSTLKPRVK